MSESVGSRMRRTLLTPPKRYQIQAVRFLEAREGRGILGDSMGLGKTYEAIAWLALNPNASPVVIVCPSNVKWQWQEMLQLHAGLPAQVLEGTLPYAPTLPIVIINYEILRMADWPKGERTKKSKPTFPWVQELLRNKPRTVILDEFQYIKTRQSLQTQASIQLARRALHVIGLSGTAIEKCPVEFFPILNLVERREFNSFWKYAFRYCDPTPAFRGRGWNFNGSDNLDELRERVSQVMIRRLKEDVAKELPRKIRVSIPVSITNHQEYREAEEDFLTWLEERSGEEAADRAGRALGLTRLGALMRLAAEGKMKAVKSWVEDFLSQEDSKLVIFCVHRPILSQLVKILPGPVAYVSGGITGRKRDEMIQRFIEDRRNRVFVGQLRAAGVGIDGLHRVSSTVLFAELGWNSSKQEQAEDRVLRIGQTASSVRVYYMIARNTVEERVLQTIRHEHDICSRVLDRGVRTLQLFDRRSLHVPVQEAQPSSAGD